MERKKTSLLIIGVCILVLSVVGITYAFWQFRAFQTDEDRLASSCFQVTLTDEKNPISLPKAYPISDEEGHELTPYEFTITNVCTTSLTYQVNLETLSLEEGQKPLPEQYIKVQLDDRTPTLLNSYESVTQTIENATASHRLTTGILDGEHKSVTYHLRLWLEETTPAIDDVMNAYFKSKITVTATYKTNEQLQNNITLSSQSNTDNYNENGESITLTATSDKYDLTEYKISERQETQNWKPISTKDTVFTITEEFNKIGTYYFAVRDEVGNIQEQEFEVTKVDTSGPNISYTEKDNHTSVELTITMKDSQSGLVKYQVIKEDLTPIMLLTESTLEPPESWTEIQNTKEDYVITKTIEDNGVYYIFAQDELGHTSSMKYSTDIIDQDPPTIELSNELSTWGASDTIHINLSDEKAGLFGYQVMKEEQEPSEWVTIENNPKSHTVDYPVTENGTYYIYAKDAYNNITHNSIEIKWVDTNQPVANVTLSLDGKTIIANASESKDTESSIASYEYKLDDDENWITDSNTHTFAVPKYGRTYKVTVRVKDVVGNVNEISDTIYMKGLVTDVIKDVEVVTTGNGLYSVNHNDANITWDGTETQKANLLQTELRYAGSDPNNYVSFEEVATGDRYELILCLQRICSNLSVIPNFEVAEFYPDSASCEAKKIDEGLISLVNGMANGDEYTLECKKTQSRGEIINSLWRIIGLVNTPEGQRVKLVKNESIGSYAWDTSATILNRGQGVNEWSESDLIKLLNPGYEKNEKENSNGVKQTNTYANNSLYWNGGSGVCYGGLSNQMFPCTFNISNKMPESLKNMIESVTWNTGSNGTEYSYDQINVNEFYNLERSNNARDTCKLESTSSGYCEETGGEVVSTTSWKGKVGLIYPSDFGYATSGGENDNRNTCLNTSVYFWNDYNKEAHPECYENDWLTADRSYWTILPYAFSNHSDHVFQINVYNVYYEVTDARKAVYPTVYLLPSVKIVGGTGTYDDMYQLSL